MSNQTTYSPSLAALGIVASHRRRIKSGRQYDRYFAKPTGKIKIIDGDADVFQTLKLMKGIVSSTIDQTKQIAEVLWNEAGKNRTAYLQRVYQFLYEHIQYKEDPNGFEDLSEPISAWHRRKEGIDCDCYTIFISSLLYNCPAGEIKHSMRIIRLLEPGSKTPKPHFQHVYVVVPANEGGTITKSRSSYIVIDPVLDVYNKEADFIYEIFDESMNGITVRQLSGINADADCGCGCGGNKAAEPTTDNLKCQLKSELAYLRATNKVAGINKDAAINAIERILAVYDNPAKRAIVIAELRSQRSQIFTEPLEGLGEPITASAAATTAAISYFSKNPDAFTNALSSTGSLIKNLFNKPGCSNVKYDMRWDFHEKFAQKTRQDECWQKTQTIPKGDAFFRGWPAWNLDYAKASAVAEDMIVAFGSYENMQQVLGTIWHHTQSVSRIADVFSVWANQGRTAAISQMLTNNNWPRTQALLRQLASQGQSTVQQAVNTAPALPNTPGQVSQAGSTGLFLGLGLTALALFIGAKFIP